MSNKQISKDNREYWQRKLSKKFDEKKSVIQSLHQLEINETSKKNYPIFIKRLGILKDLENIKKSQKEFNDYSLNFQKRLEEKRKKLKIHYDILREKLEANREIDRLLGGSRVGCHKTDLMVKGVAFIRQHLQGIISVYDLYLKIIEAKVKIVKKLEQIKVMDTFVQSDNGFEVTGEEGFVAVDRMGNALKIVDRLEFSRLNFDTGKPVT